MVDAWLCLVTEKKIFGINLSNLEKSQDDWTCLQKPKFDFSCDLPTPCLCPFLFDSNIYMASSYLDLKWDSDLEGDFLLPPNPIYEFRLDRNKKRKQEQEQPEETQKPQFSLLESFPPAPRPFLQSYITNISGDVYVYVCVDPTQQLCIPESIHVLCSGSKEWKLLPPPPPHHEHPPHFEDEIRGIRPSGMFDLNGKLFLASILYDVPYLVSFHPKEQSWMIEHVHEKNNVCLLSLRSCSDMPGVYRISLPYLSVILQDLSLSDHNVAFSYSYHEVCNPFSYSKPSCVKLTASLLNKNGGVILYQHLDQFFEGITIYCSGIFRFNLVDIGHGKLCVVLICCPRENDGFPVLCISIFTSSLVKDFSALQTDSSLMMEQTFLSVTVHNKGVYNLKDWLDDLHFMQHAFVWPPPKDARFHQRTSTTFL